MKEILNSKTVIGRIFDPVVTRHLSFFSVVVVLNSLYIFILFSIVGSFLSWFVHRLVHIQKFLAFHGFRSLAEAFTGGIHDAVGPSAIHFTDASRTG